MLSDRKFTAHEKAGRSRPYIGGPIQHSEVKAIHASNLVIPNSELTAEIFRKVYPDCMKMTEAIDTSAINEIHLPERDPNDTWTNRKYDLLFVCSRMSRPIKNPELIRTVFSRPRLARLSKLIIGEESETFDDIPNTDTLPLSSHDDILKMMLQSKVVLCPSYFDASPNVIREAMRSGCKVLISKNCGWHERFPTEYVLDDVHSPARWANRIEKLLAQAPERHTPAPFDLDGFLSVIQGVDQRIVNS